MSWPAGLSAWPLLSLLGCLCLPKGTRSSSLTAQSYPLHQSLRLVPRLDMFAPEGKVFVGLEPGLFSGVPGVGSTLGWVSAEAGVEWLKGPEGREDPWGKSFVKESPRTGRRWCLSQEAEPYECRASAGPGPWEKRSWWKGSKREASLTA